jgi:hypothetical protein
MIYNPNKVEVMYLGNRVNRINRSHFEHNQSFFDMFTSLKN